MTLKQFEQLDHSSRLKVANHAVCLRGRADGHYLIMLYQLDGFYIEVIYDKRICRITGLRPFDDMALLDPYLEKMEISLAY